MTAETNVREIVLRAEGYDLAEPQRQAGLALSFAEMTARVAQLDQFYREVMQEGTDYGVIPGTPKPTLFQPGAQLLDQIFGMTPIFEIMPTSVIDWQRPIPFFHYVVCCRLISRKSGEVMAEGIGSCNSWEDKYRWRNARPTCPECGKELRMAKDRPEWYCWKKQGGCGVTFPRDAIAAGGRVENEDSASLENTISKMAQKRAHVAATLNATGASRIFTQDIEDLPQFQQALAVESRAVATPVEQDEQPAPKRTTFSAFAYPSDEARQVDLDEYARLAKRVAVIGHDKAEKIVNTDPKTLKDGELRGSVASLLSWEAKHAPRPNPLGSIDEGADDGN